jgi:hypothetical protein
MQTTNFGLSDTLRRVKEKSLTIPQFQRPFTWRESQVKLLVDSLARSYPIGSILLLAKTPDLQLTSRSIEAVIREGYPPDGLLNSDTPPTTSEVFYVLDGQQRLTSVARVFLNAHPTKTYYFDLKSVLEDFPNEETGWVITRARSKNEPDRKDKGRLLRSDIVLDQTKTDVYVSEYIEDSGDFPEFEGNRAKAREAAARIKGVFESMRNYQIPVVILDRNAPVESVCRVFETINSTGTRLTTFDLAVARFFPTPDLRRLWTETQDNYSVLKDFEVDGERILQVLSLYLAGKENRYSEPTRSDLLSLPREFIEATWAKASESLSQAYLWARHAGARTQTLPNHGVLVAIAAFEALLPEVRLTLLENYQAILRRWYFCKVLQSGSRQAANYKIGQDFSALLRYGSTKTLPTFDEVVFSPDTLIKLNRSIDVRYKALQCLMATTIRQDLLLGNPLTDSSDIHDHHIFPRSLGKTGTVKTEELDSIVNRLSVLKDTNLRLSDQHPLSYFNELRESAVRSGTLGDLQRRLRDCLIPGEVTERTWIDQFKTENFRSFCRARADLMVARIKEIVGDSLLVSEPTADAALDDD